MACRLEVVRLGRRDKVPRDTEREEVRKGLEIHPKDPLHILSQAEMKEVVPCGNSGRS
jgi:hypothetical protein